MRIGSGVLLILCLAAAPAAARTVTWRPADAASMGAATHVEGVPERIAGPAGPALRFDGGQSLLVDTRPLVGAKAFTIEAVVRPDGGPVQQRFVHMSETDPATGLDALPGGTTDPNGRFMFEVRVSGANWYLDTFVKSAGGEQALADPTKLRPLGRWYAVAQTYDGTFYRAYVDGVLQAEARVKFTPLGPGRVRIGARMNRIDYFHGAIALIRFTDRALAPDQLVEVPRKGKS